MSHLYITIIQELGLETARDFLKTIAAAKNAVVPEKHPDLYIFLYDQLGVQLNLLLRREYNYYMVKKAQALLDKVGDSNELTGFQDFVEFVANKEYIMASSHFRSYLYHRLLSLTFTSHNIMPLLSIMSNYGKEFAKYEQGKAQRSIAEMIDEDCISSIESDPASLASSSSSSSSEPAEPAPLSLSDTVQIMNSAAETSQIFADISKLVETASVEETKEFLEHLLVHPEYFQTRPEFNDILYRILSDLVIHPQYRIEFMGYPRRFKALLGEKINLGCLEHLL